MTLTIRLDAERECTVSWRGAEVFELRADGEYAVFTIDQQPHRNYYGMGIESSFGGYSYAWSHPGRDFKVFLAQLNCDYVLGKMVGRDEVFDGEASAKAIRKEIVERRRTRSISAEDAREEWPSFESELDFDRWVHDTEIEATIRAIDTSRAVLVDCVKWLEKRVEADAAKGGV